MSGLLCNGCSYAENCNTPCMLGTGEENAKIMIVQDYPDEVDDEKCYPFSGKSCIKIRKSMDRRGIDTDNIFWTSLIKCYPDKADPKQAQVKLCQDLINAEVEVVDPEIIVCMGALATKWAGITGALTKIRGNAQEIEICGKKRIVLPTMHPRMVAIKPLYKTYILQDLDTLKALCDNGIAESEGVDYKYGETLEDCLILIDDLYQNAKELSFDIETTGKSPYMEWSKIVSISFSMKERTGCTIPLYKHDSPLKKWETGCVVKAIRKLLAKPGVQKIAQNGKFDMEWLDFWLDIPVVEFTFDSQFGHYLTVSEELGTQDLKSQAWQFTDMGGYDNELDEYRNKLSDGEGVDSRFNYDRIPWDILKKYAAGDADVTLRVKHIYEKDIEDNPEWKVVLEDIMMPASYALMEVEENGMMMDMEIAKKYIKTYKAEINRITERLESYPEVLELEREKRQLFLEREQIKLIPKKDRTPAEQEKFEKYKKYEDYKFNWNSSIQLAELLYDRLGLVTTVMTDTGKPSTNEDAMNEIREQHEIPDLLLELRKVTTLNNMFIVKLPTLVDKNNIIHPSFNITGTVTGRMSSENPNQQQLPRPAENPLLFQYQNEIKSLFCSRFGRNGCIMNADYSALEMRIACVISGDETLLHAFQSGADLHKSTASLVWGVPIDKVSKEMRTNAKSVNFGIIYGKSGVTFAKDLFYDPSGKNPKKTDDWDSAKAEGMKLVEDYLNTFSGLKKWLNNTKKFANKYGYVKTMFGRRRRLPDLKSRVPSLKTSAERQAINAPIQGTGSDLTLLSIISINKKLKENGFKSLLICTVHDSIVFDVYIPELPEVAKMVKNTMEHIHEPYIDTEVPIISEIEVGRSYGTMFECELEDVENLNTVESFDKWVHQNSIKKYKKEVDAMVDADYTVDMMVDYLDRNNRPIKELMDYIVEKIDEKEAAHG